MTQPEHHQRGCKLAALTGGEETEPPVCTPQADLTPNHPCVSLTTHGASETACSTATPWPLEQLSLNQLKNFFFKSYFFRVSWKGSDQRGHCSLPPGVGEACGSWWNNGAGAPGKPGRALGAMGHRWLLHMGWAGRVTVTPMYRVGRCWTGRTGGRATKAVLICWALGWYKGFIPEGKRHWGCDPHHLNRKDTALGCVPPLPTPGVGSPASKGGFPAPGGSTQPLECDSQPQELCPQPSPAPELVQLVGSDQHLDSSLLSPTQPRHRELPRGSAAGASRRRCGEGWTTAEISRC